MKLAVGILLTAYFFLMVPFFAGILIDAITGDKKKSMTVAYINGFVAMLAAFWCVAVLFLYRGCTLKKLSLVWLLATIAICGISVITNRTKIAEYFKNTNQEKKTKITRAAMLVSVVLVLISVLFIEPQKEQTVETVATSVATNTTYVYQPYTGEQYPMTQTEKIFSPYEMLYAVIALVSGLHPAFLIKMVLPLFIIPFFMGCYWELSCFLFEHEKKKVFFFLLTEAIYFVPVYTAIDAPVTGIFRSCWNGSVLLNSCILPYSFLLVLQAFEGSFGDKKKDRAGMDKHPCVRFFGLTILTCIAAQLLDYNGWLYMILVILLTVFALIVRKGYQHVRVLDRH